MTVSTLLAPSVPRAVFDLTREAQFRLSVEIYLGGDR